MTCSSCTKSIPNDCRFCPFCGTVTTTELRLLQEADTLASTALQQKSTVAENHFRKGETFYDLKAGTDQLDDQSLDEVLGHFSKAVQLDFKNAKYHKDVGWILQRAESFEASLPFLKAAVALDPIDSDAREYLNKSKMLLKEQRRLQKQNATHQRAEGIGQQFL
jgi:tetratricopeptide (TPR) repeat protein